MWNWVSGGCVAASGIGLVAMRWELALLALPALVIEVARARREP